MSTLPSPTSANNLSDEDKQYVESLAQQDGKLANILNVLQQQASLAGQQITQLQTDVRNLHSQVNQKDSQLQTLQQQHAALQQAQPSSNQLKLRSPQPDLPEAFTGRSTSKDEIGQFIEKFDQYFAFFDLPQSPPLPAAQRVCMVVTKLDGDASTWFRHYRQRNLGNRNPRSWQDFKILLRNKYEPVNKEDTLRDKLAQLVQSKSVAAYTTRFEKLLNQLPSVSDDEALDRYIRGLNPTIRTEVRLKKPATLDEAIDYADIFDRATFEPRLGRNRSRRDRLANRNRTDHSNVPSPMDIDTISLNNLTSILNAVSRQQQQNTTTTRRPPLSDEVRAACLANGCCFNCGERGHRTRGCPTEIRTTPLTLAQVQRRVPASGNE